MGWVGSGHTEWVKFGTAGSPCPYVYGYVGNLTHAFLLTKKG